MIEFFKDLETSHIEEGQDPRLQDTKQWVQATGRQSQAEYQEKNLLTVDSKNLFLLFS